MDKFDLVIIGAGPGGYTGAIRAAQLGMKVAIIEKNPTLGGTCLNVGCIPSKALLDSSEHYDLARHQFKDHGIVVNNVQLDLPTMLARKDKVVKDLTNGVAFLMKKNKVETIFGSAKLKSGQKVEVQLNAGGVRELEAGKILLATGSVPVGLPTLQFDGQRVISSTEALCLKKVPEHLLVVGGGVIGLEMGSVWLRLGAKVTVIEFNDKICGNMDRGVSLALQKILEKQGFKFLLNTKVVGARIGAENITLQMEAKTGEKLEPLVGEIALVAVGRKPYSEGLGLDEIGIKKDQAGRVQIDSHFQTNVPGVYAIGDLVQGPMLAHKAEEEGVAVAEILAGKAGHVNYHTVPGVVYTWPEFASVGYSEEQCKEKAIEYKVGSFPFMANGRAKAMASTDGMVKIIAHAKTDQVLGVHILGPRASDIISEAVTVMEFGGSAEDIARSFHAHPTLPEAIREAALAVDKRARQI